jgi:hypothetical protein
MEHQEQLVEKLATNGAVVALRGDIGRRGLDAADLPCSRTGIGDPLPSLETAPH